MAPFFLPRNARCEGIPSNRAHFLHPFLTSEAHAAGPLTVLWRRVVAEKPTFVDTIREATRQRRRWTARYEEPSEAEDKPRLSHWPPPRQSQWRLALLKPWNEGRIVGPFTRKR